MHFHRIALGLLLAGGLGKSQAFAQPFTFSYAGRLADASDKATTGPVDIELKFYRTAAGGTPIGVSPVVFNGVKLEDGVFQVDVTTLDPAEVHLVFSSTLDTYLEVKDLTNGVVYPRQRYTAIPYALKVPVDGQSIDFNANGQLSVKTLPVASGTSIVQALNAGTTTGTLPASRLPFLSGDVTGSVGATQVTKILGKSLSMTGLADGDFLKYDQGTQTWKPGGVSGANGGTVTNVSAASPLSVTSGSSTPNITISAASTSSSGYLTQTDWNTFNGKQNSLGFTPVDSAAPSVSADLSMNGNKITGVTDPTAAQDAATKAYVDAEVGTKQNDLGFAPVNSASPSVSANLNMNGNKVTNVTDPTAAQDAATKSYVDSGLGGKQNTLGFTPVNSASPSVAGSLNMNGNKITNVTDPTTAQEAATKAYVDAASAASLPLTGGTMAGVLAMNGNAITGAGNVGIGTTTPSTQLVINHASTPTMKFLNGAGYTTLGTSGMDFSLTNASATGKIKFSTNGSDRVVIDQNGKVGIGTPAPGLPLHVVGDVRIEDGAIRMLPAPPPGTPEPGDVWFDDVTMNLTSYEPLGKKDLAGLVFQASVDSNTVMNSASENMFTPNFMVPSNALTAGKVLRVRAVFEYGTAASPPNLMLRLKYGSNTILTFSTGSLTASVTAKSMLLEATVTVRSVGGAGTAATFSSGVLFVEQPSAAPGMTFNTMQSTITGISTIAPAPLQLSAQWSTANASNTIKFKEFSIETAN